MAFSTSKSLVSFGPLHATRQFQRQGRGGGRSYYDDNNNNDGEFDGPDDEEWLRPSSKSSTPRRPNPTNNEKKKPFRDNNSNNKRNDSRIRVDRAAASKREVEVDITDTNAHFFSKKSLTDPSLHMAESGGDKFLELCQGAGITRPSRIQSLAWPQILTGQHTIVADQTGSGKTLAYLLPLLQKALSTQTTKGANGTPKILILAPTAELADQLRAVCDKISQQVPFSTMVITANGKYTTSIRDQIRRLQRTPVDVLISTPGRVSTILRTRNAGLDLSHLQAIVLDEVDILLIDETFGPQLRTVGEAAPIGETQFVFVTATLPDQIVQTVQAEFPGVQQVRGPGLHRVAPSMKENLVDVSVPAQFNRDADKCFDVKAEQLLRALRQNRCRRTLIFCNTVDSCRDVENLLKRHDRKGQIYEVGAYHNAMTPEARNANLEVFSKGRGSRDDDSNNKVDYILICTDRAARGVDFEAAPVDHVVIFDFPKDPAEYVRRVGRTARAGRKGTSTVLAHGWQLPIARQVMSGNTKLDGMTMAAIGDNNDDDENYDWRKKRRTRKTKEAIIKENIEGGTLWDK